MSQKCENKVNTYVHGDCCSHGKRMDFDGKKFVPRKKKGARALETFDLDALFDEIIGMDQIKTDIKKIYKSLVMKAERKAKCGIGTDDAKPIHFIFRKFFITIIFQNRSVF